MYNHNKAQQSKNHVHISWDILYYWVLLFNLMVLRNWLHFKKILQLPLYSLYSLSGEGRKSGWILQTWECTFSHNTVQLGTQSVALECQGISTRVICPAWITAIDWFGWSSCYQSLDPTKLQDDWGVYTQGYQTLKHSFVMAITRKWSSSILQNAHQLFSLMTKW